MRPLNAPRLVAVGGPRLSSAAEATDTATLLRQFREATAPTQVFAEATDIPTELIECPPQESFDEALSRGARGADAQADRGTDLVLPASIGAGDEEEALALLGLLCQEDPVTIVGFHGTADRQWSQRVSLVRDLMFQGRIHRGSAHDLLYHLASPAMIALVGFLAQCAVRRTPILLDTTVTCVAACYAEALAPGAKQWMLAGQLTPQAGHLLALRRIGVTPLFALNMPLGMGTGAATALPLIRAATALYAG
nr:MULTISPECIES: nicotinate-nucleotide--dimethylbenzimidazole phosphoribosyltransferase [unclassified Corynebacterium]